MADYLRTALLLEEKAATLPQDSPRRAQLLGLAKAARQLGLEEAAKREAINRFASARQQVSKRDCC